MTDDGIAATDALFDWRSYWESTDATPDELLSALIASAAFIANEIVEQREFLRICALAWEENRSALLSLADNNLGTHDGRI